MSAVFKFGSSAAVDYPRLDYGVENVSQDLRFQEMLRGPNPNVAIIFSGAVLAGSDLEVDATLPSDRLKAVQAAVGQLTISSVIQNTFQVCQVSLGELLVSDDWFLSDGNSISVRPEFSQLLEDFRRCSVVPLINGNTVATKTFPNQSGRSISENNDLIAALVANCLGVDELYFFTSIGGVRKVPADNSDQYGSVDLEQHGEELYSACSEGVSFDGTGGMMAKLQAAELFLRHPANSDRNQRTVYICSARKNDPVLHPAGTSISLR